MCVVDGGGWDLTQRQRKRHGGEKRISSFHDRRKHAQSFGFYVAHKGAHKQRLFAVPSSPLCVRRSHRAQASIVK